MAVTSATVVEGDDASQRGRIWCTPFGSIEMSKPGFVVAVVGRG